MGALLKQAWEGYHTGGNNAGMCFLSGDRDFRIRYGIGKMPLIQSHMALIFSHSLKNPNSALKLRKDGSKYRIFQIKK